MVKKLYKRNTKIILIFLTFIFFSTSIFSIIQTIKYKKNIDDSKFRVESVDDKVDANIYRVFLKFTRYRNDEMINKMDFTDKIKSSKEADNLNKETDIKNIQEDIKAKKEELIQGNNLSKEKLNEEIKKLEEEEKKEIEEINNMHKKSDEEYKKEFIESEIQSKLSLERYIQTIENYKYFMVDNKNGEFETNSSYSKDEIEESFFTDSKYAVKLYTKNNKAVVTEEYVDGKSIKSTGNKLQESKDSVIAGDVTLYLWVPSELWENKANDDLYNNFIIVSIISSVLLFVFVILVWITRNKVQVNYSIYNKVPVDIVMIALFAIGFLYIWKSGAFYIRGMFWGYNTEKLNPYTFIIGTGLYGTFLSTYIEFINKVSFKEVVEKSFLVKWNKIVKSSLEVKGMLFKLRLLVVIIILQIIFASNSYFIFKNRWLFVPVIFITFDIVLYFIFAKKLIYFNKILVGTDKITNGDLTFVLEEQDNGNLSKLSKNINNMKSGLKNSLEKEMRSERMKSELITNVSHDLKTPLTSIINYVDLLKKEELTPHKARDYVEILDRKAKRLKALVEDLFEASKAASGAMELNIEKIEITELMKQTLAEFEDKILESTLYFKVNLGAEKVYAMGDGRRTYRVFENLVQNVLKYSMKHSRVYIDLIQEDGNKKFIIKNISSYEMNFDSHEITERFKRGDLARSTEGSGLGLAIAKSIMELQGGELNIQVDGDLFKATVIFKD